MSAGRIIDGQKYVMAGQGPERSEFYMSANVYIG